MQFYYQKGFVTNMKKSKSIPFIVYLSLTVGIIVIIAFFLAVTGLNKKDNTQAGASVVSSNHTESDADNEHKPSNSENQANGGDDDNQSNNNDKPPLTTQDYSDDELSNVKVTGKRRNVAYYTSWSAYARNVMISDIDASLLTHLNFAFANLNADGEVIIGDSWVDVEKPMGGESWDSPSDSRGHFAQLKTLKSKYPHLKTLISVGGWTWSSNFSDVAADPAKRKRFAESSAAFVSKYGFDGVDIDWEFPVEGGNNITHRPEDKQNYTKLMKETREALTAQGKKDGKSYLLTIAGGPNVSFAKNTELKELMKYLDFINVMTYDYHGAWETTTNHNTPLYANPNDPTQDNTYSVDSTIQAYLDAGVKPEDMNLGLAFYGRGWVGVVNTANNGLWQEGQAPVSAGFGSGSWEGGCFDYIDIVENYIGKGNYTRYFDPVAKVPYLYNGTSFISYDDEESIKIKLQYAEKMKLGGTMFWEFSADKKKTLQKVIADFYGNNLDTGTTPTSNKENNNGTPILTSSDDTAATPSGDEWESSKEYQAGDTVTYQGKKYTANWWNQGETPDPSNEWGAWKLG